MRNDDDMVGCVYPARPEPWRPATPVPPEAYAWAEAHRRELPTTLAALVQFPMGYRRVIVRYLEPSTQIVIWREHYSSFVGPNSLLSARQQEFIRYTIHMLPRLFEAAVTGLELEVWIGRMEELFSLEKGKRIFESVGPPEPSGGLPMPPDVPPPGAA